MYVNTVTKELVSRRQLQLRNPNTSLPAEPADIPSLDMAYLYDIHRPEVPFGHILVAGGPELVDGKWRVSQEVVARPVESVAAELKARATAIRWEKETAGIVVAGATIGTTIDDQNRITSVVANAVAGGVSEVKFKAASGWATLTIAEVQGIAGAIAQHVQQCFAAEHDHHVALDAITTLEALASYDVTTGWPATA